MDEQEKNDLLIKIATRQESLKEQFDERQEILNSQFSDVKDQFIAGLNRIESKMSDCCCIRHSEKIKTLERITWGALIAALAATVKSFWDVIK